uniref:Retinal guanylyl cyclase 1 n=2 Tax=Lygus hesperus TaxID=30085 RepID=A0A0A9XFB7_LYGHE
MSSDLPHKFTNLLIFHQLHSKLSGAPHSLSSLSLTLSQLYLKLSLTLAYSLSSTCPTTKSVLDSSSAYQLRVPIPRGADGKRIFSFRHRRVSPIFELFGFLQLYFFIYLPSSPKLPHHERLLIPKPTISQTLLYFIL